jgi:anti-sigma factor RsiW
MRGNLSEQDLTDYALNELNSVDRLYVESLLAASDECRNDICETIEMAQLLEQGFERELIYAERQELGLLEDQRAKLAEPHFNVRYALRDFVGGLSVAACLAFGVYALGNFEIPTAKVAAGHVAQASTKAAGTMSTAVHNAPEKLDLGKVLSSLREMAEESSKLIPASDMLTDPTAVCTPPTLILESAHLASPFGDM